jgi:cytokinin dehydrogenase
VQLRPASPAAAPAIQGRLRFDDDARTAAADDFGHLVHRTPAAVLSPASDQDVAAVIHWAARRGKQVAPRGQGHSVFGRSMVHDGIVIDMTRLRAVGAVDSDRVVAEAGAKWSEVLAVTLPRGLTPPVLTDYLELTVGGTLAVGGIGSKSSRSGLQTDNVLELKVVTVDGRELTCSPDHNRDLFDAVRAGLGQVGVITRATLRLIPAPRQVRRFLLTYRDLGTMLADQRRLAADGRFDAVQGAVLATPTGAWTLRLDAAKDFNGDPPDDRWLLAGLSDDRLSAKPSTLSYRDYLGRLAAFEEALRANGQWLLPHPWLTTFVGDAEVASVAGAELAKLVPADLGPLGQIGLSAFHRRAITTPLARLPADDLCYAFNFIRVPTTREEAEIRRLVSANRSAYDRIRAMGGTLYPVSAFPMSRADWRQHFGSTFDSLADAKHKFDPGRVLTPGYEVF